MGKKLSGRDLIKLGFPQNNSINVTLGQINRYQKRKKKEQILLEAKQVLLHPENYKGDGVWGKIAESLLDPVLVTKQVLNSVRAPFQIFGENEIDDKAKYQLFDALKLPVAVAGALMPDAHAGYGLPIGGVLATKNAVIPYGLGVDIGCRMSLSIYDLNSDYLKRNSYQFKMALKEKTNFGTGGELKIKQEHEVLDNTDFQLTPLLRQLHSRAVKQLGTSGSGNHFVEFGMINLIDGNDFGIAPGEYVGLLSHSGSRGFGATIAKHYMGIAMEQCLLPRNAHHLAWLDFC